MKIAERFWPTTPTVPDVGVMGGLRPAVAQPPPYERRVFVSSPGARARASPAWRTGLTLRHFLPEADPPGADASCQPGSHGWGPEREVAAAEEAQRDALPDGGKVLARHATHDVTTARRTPRPAGQL